MYIIEKGGAAVDLADDDSDLFEKLRSVTLDALADLTSGELSVVASRTNKAMSVAELAQLLQTQAQVSSSSNPLDTPTNEQEEELSANTDKPTTPAEATLADAVSALASQLLSGDSREPTAQEQVTAIVAGILLAGRSDADQNSGIPHAVLAAKTLVAGVMSDNPQPAPQSSHSHSPSATMASNGSTKARKTTMHGRTVYRQE